MQVTQKNYPDTIQIGDVSEIGYYKGSLYSYEKGYIKTEIDLLIGGSPCQGFSFAGKQLNFEDERSKLFFEYVRLLKETQPKHFLLENVKMRKEYQDIISQYLGVEPILIDSALVSGQTRKRLYWTNIPNVAQPEDKGIYLKDVIETGYVDKNKSYCIDANYFKGGNLKNYFEKRRRQLVFNGLIQIGVADLKGHDFLKRVYSVEGKCPTLTAVCGGNQERKIAIDDKHWRKLTPLECERLQTLPDQWTEGISNTQRYKCLGNSFTVDVIAHILKNLKEVK
jgi:site-specific DNA-cytosine methylase